MHLCTDFTLFRTCSSVPSSSILENISHSLVIDSLYFSLFHAVVLPWSSQIPPHTVLPSQLWSSPSPVSFVLFRPDSLCKFSFFAMSHILHHCCRSVEFSLYIAPVHVVMCMNEHLASDSGACVYELSLHINCSVAEYFQEKHIYC